MRLNRGSFIFLAVIVVFIIVAGIFFMTDGANNAVPTAAATTTNVNVFAGIQPTSIGSLTITSRLSLPDTRPTPLPNNPPLPTLTPVPDGEEAPTETKTLALSLDPAGVWVLGDNNTVAGSGTIVQSSVTAALNLLIGLQSTQSFIPADGNYAQFGLDNPTHDITFVVNPPASTVDPSGATSVSTAPPQTMRIRLGDKTVNETQYFAFLYDDSQTVYVLSAASNIDNTLLRLVTQPPFAPPPTATPQPILNIQLPFGTFNLNLANRVSIVDNSTGESLAFLKGADAITWTIENADPNRQVDSVRIPIYLIEFGNISGVSQTTVPDLSTVGLDNPRYVISAAMGDGRVYTLRLGNTDPTGALYYALVDEFPQVVLIQAGTVAPFLDLLANPPYIAVEATAEATAEMTAEVTAEATAELTPEATEANGN